MMHTLKPEVRGELDIRKNFCKTDTETKCLSLLILFVFFLKLFRETLT